MKSIIIISIILSLLSGCATQKALHSAVAKEKHAKTETLINEKEVNPFIKNSKGVSAFDLAIEKYGVEGLPEWAKPLYEKSHVRSVDLYNRVKLGILDVEGFRQELEKNSFYLETPNSNGDTLLSALVRNKQDEKYIQALIDAGASVNSSKNNGPSPLLAAVGTEQPLLVEMLLAAGSNPNQMSNFLYPLSMAIYTGNIEITKLLISAGAGVGDNAKRGIEALFSVTRGATSGNRTNDIELAKLLLKSGVELNVKDSRGRSLLYQAIENKRPEMRDFLIEQGINLDLANDENKTALMQAVFHNDTASVQALIAAGADLDLQDNDGWTPLIRATYDGNLFWLNNF